MNKVLKKIDNAHSIEYIENSPWKPSENAIRIRIVKNGRYDRVSSSIIPIENGFSDIVVLLCTCLKEDKIISNKQMGKIMMELIKSWIRKIWHQLVV
jgi:hypothetical protein